jgi:hypothetical protein
MKRCIRAAAQAKSQRTPILATDGQPLGEARLDRAQSAGFKSWLIDFLPRLHAGWVTQQLLTDHASAGQYPDRE